MLPLDLSHLVSRIAGMATRVGMQHGARQPISTRTRKGSGSSGRKLQDEHFKPYTTLGHCHRYSLKSWHIRKCGRRDKWHSSFRTPTPSLLSSFSITIDKHPALSSEKNITCILTIVTHRLLLQLPGPRDTCPHEVFLCPGSPSLTPPIHTHEATLPSRTHPTS